MTLYGSSVIQSIGDKGRAYRKYNLEKKQNQLCCEILEQYKMEKELNHLPQIFEKCRLRLLLLQDLAFEVHSEKNHQKVEQSEAENGVANL